MADKDATQTESSGTPSSEPKPEDQNEPSSENKDFDPPQEPTPEELAAVEVPTAPAAIDATAVETVMTVEGEKKYGWQQKPIKPELVAEPCFHTGIVQARKHVPAYEIGHEWICTCGTIFVVHVNRGGKKTLIERDSIPSESPGLTP